MVERKRLIICDSKNLQSLYIDCSRQSYKKRAHNYIDIGEFQIRHLGNSIPNQ
jgi:hypothetical protein